jgi:uncharacterized protein
MLCAWGTLCILFWQGSWQLLYHPVSAVGRTPASVNLPFESIGFATNAAGQPQLRGWWIPPSSHARFTALYFHGADGNLGDTVNELSRLHEVGLGVIAFDYRGYGQSQFAHPSEARWREDADSAIAYLTGTRHVPASSIVLMPMQISLEWCSKSRSILQPLPFLTILVPTWSPHACWSTNDGRPPLPLRT